MESSKKIPIKFIKYEDLINQTYIVVLEIIEHINEITKNNQKIDKQKLKNTLRSTNFETLKKNERDKGFSEAVPLREDKNKKVPFFHLGPKNDWKKILNSDLKLKIEKAFEQDLKELSYL